MSLTVARESSVRLGLELSACDGSSGSLPELAGGYPDGGYPDDGDYRQQARDDRDGSQRTLLGRHFALP